MEEEGWKSLLVTDTENLCKIKLGKKDDHLLLMEQVQNLGAKYYLKNFSLLLYLKSKINFDQLVVVIGNIEPLSFF